VQHEPVDIYTATTEQTSGSSGSGQQGAGDTDDEMEYIMRDAPSTSRAPVINMEDESYVGDVCTKATNQTSGPSGSGQQGAVDADVETEYVRGVEYEAYYKRAGDTFHKIFVNNTFGHVCDVCDRIWFKFDLSLITVSQVAVLEEEFANERDRLPTFKLCSTCRQPLNAKNKR
jgi:hypothetical protein